MKKAIAVVLVLLACALVLGAGGVVLTASENSAGNYEMTIPTLTADRGAVAFCDPLADPTCMPPKP